MTIKSSGSLSVAEIAAEFGGTKPYSLSAYYRGGSRVSSSATTKIPTSGANHISNYYGAAAYVPGSAVYNSAGTYTLTPVGASTLNVIAGCGGGGGGGGLLDTGNGSDYGSSGGGSSGIMIKGLAIAITAGHSFQITVGGGGTYFAAGGVTQIVDLTTGATLLYLAGGNPGQNVTGGYNWYGVGGTCASHSSPYYGYDGTAAVLSGSSHIAGNGGAGLFGGSGGVGVAAGSTYNSHFTAASGTDYGSGGAGAGSTNANSGGAALGGSGYCGYLSLSW